MPELPVKVNVDRKGGCSLGWFKNGGLGPAQLASYEQSNQVDLLIASAMMACILLEVAPGKVSGGVVQHRT